MKSEVGVPDLWHHLFSNLIEVTILLRLPEASKLAFPEPPFVRVSCCRAYSWGLNRSYSTNEQIRAVWSFWTAEVEPSEAMTYGKPRIFTTQTVPSLLVVPDHTSVPLPSLAVRMMLGSCSLRFLKMVMCTQIKSVMTSGAHLSKITSWPPSYHMQIRHQDPCNHRLPAWLL